MADQTAAGDLATTVAAGYQFDGPALELGIGTGRIALPLARRGVPVHGIDMSRAMVARLRATHPEVWQSVSLTTRGPRPGEIDGLHYQFCDDATFDRAKEYAVYAGLAAGAESKPEETPRPQAPRPAPRAHRRKLR